MYSPNWEAIKEVARWCICAVASFVFTVILDQIKLVPEILNVKLWVITFPIPIQAVVWFVSTNALRYIDKVKFETFNVEKEEPITYAKLKKLINKEIEA